MFNLDHAISEWRKQMLAAGIKTPVPLEELEIHLREEIERQMISGLNEQQSFVFAVGEIGQPKKLKNEFQKVDGSNLEKFMNKLKIKPLGTYLVFGAIAIGVLLQIFTDSFISFHHDGALAAVIFHWPVFLVMAAHLAGLICLTWPAQKQTS
jgi:hypothetical protein